MASQQLSEKSIFMAAIEIDSLAERDAYLEEVCGGNEELRAAVNDLLESHQRCGSLLDAPVIGDASTDLDAQVSEGQGSIIGRYKLLQRVGEGGFGLVYMAEQQEPVVRKVALKIIKLGMDTRQVVARFEAERQALAMMDHPNIAKMHDAGATDSGRPYFVMELVRGVPITQYSDSNRLDMRQRLGLFIDVCHAVQHAHQKGIIHRDIKPNNVMITMRDGQPVPKVIDFGIAKATQQRLTEKTLFTNYHQFVGTPQYMSPEQATMSEHDVDTRTDIYSLGVLLYELLVGRTPFEAARLQEVGFDDVCRIIREEEPPRPSRCLSSLGEAKVTTISSDRQTQPTLLQRQVHGDLDWIVMKAIDKDRNRRYATANDFAADIERYLKDDPVDARQPSTTYVFRKFARRNRALLTTLTLVAASIILGTVFSIWFGVSATFARRELEIEQQRLLQQQEQTEAARSKAEDLRYVSDITRAMHALADDDWRQIRRLLKAHHPSADGKDRRGWEWYYLWRACRNPVPTLFHVHGVNHFAISPDGKTLVSGDTAGHLNLWDLSSRTLLHSTKAHRSWVWNVDVSPDGTWVASSGADDLVRLWRLDPELGRLTSEAVLQAGNDSNTSYHCVAFSSDGRLLADARHLKTRLWDLSSRKVVHEFASGWPYALAFHPDDEALAAHCGEEVLIWNLDIDAEPWVIPDLNNITWTGLAISPDGRLLAASWRKEGLKLFSSADRAEVHWLGSDTEVTSIAFAPDGETIAAGNWDKNVCIWSTTDGSLVRRLRGHSNGITCVKFTPNGKTLASSSTDRTIRLWQLDREESHAQQPEYPVDYSGPVAAISFSANGQWMATTNGVGNTTAQSKVVLWDTNSWQVAREFEGRHFAFSPDNRLLAIGDRQWKTVQLWDLRAHPPRRINQIRGSGPLTFLPDGHLVLGGRQTLELWNTWGTKQPVAKYSASNSSFKNFMVIDCSPDGRILAAADWRGDIALLNARTLKLLHHAEEAVELWGHHIAFSPDSRYLVTPDYDHTVKVWDVSDGDLQLTQTLSGHTNSVVCAVFSSEGILASGANDQVKLWDSATWQERATFKSTDSSVSALCFSPDGSTLVTGSNDGILRIHRAASREEVIEVERSGRDPLDGD